MKKRILIIIQIFIFTLSAQIWTRNGPFAANVTSLSIAPSDSNVIYVGTLGTGVYKSINGADSWIKCGMDLFPEWSDSLRNNHSPTVPCWWYGETFPVNDIAIDPLDKDHVWIGFGSKGLYESNDGGSSWSKADPSLPDSLDVDYIHVNKDNPNKIFVGAGRTNYESLSQFENGGLYRTDDGGNNWSVVDSIPHGGEYNRINCIGVDPGNEDHIFVSVAYSLFESVNGGDEWNELAGPVTDFFDICIDPENAQNIFSILYTGWMDWVFGWSTDSGLNWSYDYDSEWETSLYADTDFNLYVSEHWEMDLDSYVKKSRDNGNTWEYIDTLCAGRGVNLRNRCEAQAENPENIYFGTQCGIYSSSNGGMNCSLKNSNIYNSYIVDLEIHPTNPNIVYAGGFQGLWKSDDGCSAWYQVNDEDINVIKFDQINPDTLYYGGQNLMRSYDGGLNFEDIRNSIIGDVSDIKINPLSNNIVYAVSIFYGTRLYKSVDYGENWNYIHGCDFNNYPLITIDPNNPDTLYFDRFRSIDGGSSWSEVFEDEVIGVHPQNSNTIYCSDKNTLKVSYDWGVTFETLDEYLNWTVPFAGINNLTFDKNNPDIMLYSTPNNGIHHSSDGGKNWYVLDGSYEKRTLDAIPVPNEDKLYIATHGDGVWVGENLSLGIDNGQFTVNNYELGQNYPNPFNPNTEIEYSLKNSGLVKISIFNSQGQFVKELVNCKMNKGIHKENFNAKELNSGAYFYQLSIDGTNLGSKKMLYLR